MIVNLTLSVTLEMPDGTVSVDGSGGRAWLLPDGGMVKPWAVLELNDERVLSEAGFFRGNPVSGYRRYGYGRSSGHHRGVRSMSDEYNGWTNYATWRVRLEMFDGYDAASDNDLDAYDLGESLSELALDTITEQSSGLARSYALAFLNEVNWGEIASHMIEDYRTSDDFDKS